MTVQAVIYTIPEYTFMKSYIETLIKNPLFVQIKEEEIETLLDCLHTQEQSFDKYAWITLQQPNQKIGIILEGTLQISKYDFQGNKMLLTSLSKGDLFAEVFAVAQTTPIPIHIQVQKKAHILWIPYQNIINPCTVCPFHLKLIQNLLQILANKNLMLNKKMEYLSCRTLQERILTYLHDIAQKQHRTTFEIPFNRQELADFLCVDRSALSRELSKLQKKGIIQYHKNTFTLVL